MTEPPCPLPLKAGDFPTRRDPGQPLARFSGREDGDHPEGRQAQIAVDVFHRLDLIIDVIEEEHQTDPTDQGQEETQDDILGALRPHRDVWQLRVFGDEDIALDRSRGDGDLFLALEQLVKQ